MKITLDSRILCLPAGILKNPARFLLRGFAVVLIFILSGCPGSTVGRGGHINLQPFWVRYGVIAPGPVSTDPAATSGSIVSISPANDNFTIRRPNPQGFTVSVYRAPLGAPPLRGIANVRVDIQILEGNDQGITSLLRDSTGTAGTALTTKTDNSGNVRFTIEAITDGDDQVVIGILTEDRPGHTTWVRRRFLVTKSYETSRQ